MVGLHRPVWEYSPFPCSVRKFCWHLKSELSKLYTAATLLDRGSFTTVLSKLWKLSLQLPLQNPSACIFCHCFAYIIVVHDDEIWHTTEDFQEPRAATYLLGLQGNTWKEKIIKNLKITKNNLMNSVPYMRKVCINTERCLGLFTLLFLLPFLRSLSNSHKISLKNVTIFFFSWLKY